MVQAWMPCLVTGLLPAWGLVRLRRHATQRALRRQCLSEACGYDLRSIEPPFTR